MRRAWLRGRENLHKRYLIHVAGHNLGLLMRHLIGAGTPKEAIARGWALIIVLCGDEGLPDMAILALVIVTDTGLAGTTLMITLDRPDR